MHLYLHIPFCHRICPYCSFYKHTPGGTDQGAFVEALLTEADFAQRETPQQPQTLYLGGGTPSMLSPTHLRRLFTGLRERFSFADLKEVTFEANPATFTARTAALYEELGITRVSLGIQSFHPQHLKTLGREHSVSQALSSARVLQERNGLEVNIDLIFSVPGQTLSDWSDTLDQALDLRPQHLSAYNLTYEEDTAFFDSFQKGSYQEDDDTNAEMFLLADQKLTAAGYLHYETSNYSLPGQQSRHNRGYWVGNDYLGLGPSAVSTIARTRWRNVPDTARYLTQIAAVGHARTEIELLDDEAFALERLALMLRTTEGVPLKYLNPDANLAPFAELLEKNGTHLRTTPQGALLVDSLAEALA